VRWLRHTAHLWRSLSPRSWGRVKPIDATIIQVPTGDDLSGIGGTRWKPWLKNEILWIIDMWEKVMKTIKAHEGANVVEGCE